MGWSNVGVSVLEAATVIIQTGTAGSGIFVYNGVPAAGNLIGSWTAAAGTDQFGNAYAGGFTVGPGSGSTGSVQIMPVPSDTGTGGQIAFLTGEGFEVTPANLEGQLIAGGQVLGVTLSGAVVSGGSSVPPNIAIQSTGTGGQGSSINMFVSNHADTAEFGVLIDGGTQSIQFSTLNAANPGFIVADTWHDVTLQHGWTEDGTNHLQYKFDALGWVRLRGSILAGTTADGTVIGSLPAGYRPQHDTLELIARNGVAGAARTVIRSATGNIEIYDEGGAGGLAGWEQVAFPTNG